MPNIPEFNSDLDKITEQELVPNIYSRMKINCELLNDNNLGFNMDDITIKDVDTKIISSLPTFISDNIQIIYSTRINIYEGNDNINTLVAIDTSTNNYRYPVIIKAYLESASIDVTSLIRQELIDDRMGFILDIDTPFTNSDVLKIYYYMSTSY